MANNCTHNQQNCPCTSNCSYVGKCCECVAYHRKNDQLPACYFAQEGAKGDMGLEAFYQLYQQRKEK